MGLQSTHEIASSGSLNMDAAPASAYTHPSEHVPGVITGFQQDPIHLAAQYSLKRKRTGYQLKDEPTFDVISQGLITQEEAEIYFKAFFKGCVRLDPHEEVQS